MEFADGYEGVTHAGLLLVALDTGRMLLAQRDYDESDDPDVQETWEIPGGGLEEGEDPLAGALREFTEEVGLPLGPHEVVHGWRAGPEDNYQGFVVAIQSEIPVDQATPDPEEVQNVGWYTVEEARRLPLRPEFEATDIEALVAHAVSGNEDGMPEEITAATQVGTADDYMQVDEEGNEVFDTEPEFDPLDFAAGPIPIHGVIAPEGAESGDGRGFLDGAMTTRPLRIPFRWQESDIGGHDGAVTVGSVDRAMRKGGLIHFEGLLMATEKAGELVDVIEFFDNRYGVSVDGDKGALSADESEARGGTWFESVRAAGLTAVAIPAFAEAYVSLGPHPDMPGEDEESDALVAGAMSREMLQFKRGKGWVTNPKETSRLHRYWTQKGQPGYAKIGWGTPGDWRRAKALIGAKIAANSPEKMRFLNQIISQWHFDALGYWPGELGKPGNAPDTKENRQRAARHAAAAETVTAAQDEEKPENRITEEDKAEITRLMTKGLRNEGIEVTDNAGDTESVWEAVLVSSVSGNRVKPPTEYFHRHPDTASLTVDEPDAEGIRRVYGYAAEWGVCHVGMSGRCVEPPRTGSDDYPEFHLGRTKTKEGFVPTGVLTYGVGHRDAETILSESAEQAYFDNVNNAWAAVRVGEDDNGVWFSGVVLPGVPEEHLVKIEASGQVSGEWLRGAMRACLTVNVPGYPVRGATAEYDANGNVVALAASAFGGVDNAPCTEPTPAERMMALRAVDAEVRFDAMKSLWEGRSA